MLQDKVYSETVDVRDPEGYSADPDRYINTFLHQRYVGRCRKGAFIVAIKKILRRSDCRLKVTDLTAEGYVNIEFIATVSIYGQWDVVTGVKIATRTQLIVGESQVEGVAAVSLLATPEADTIDVNQIVAVRVLRAQYTPDQGQATIVGPLLTCDKAAPSFRISSDLTQKDAKELLPLVDRIKSLLDERAALAKTRRDDLFFFETLLYSFVRNGEDVGQKIETEGAADWEGPASAALPAGATAVNMATMVSDVAAGQKPKTMGVWCRDLSLYRSSPFVTQADTDTLPAGWSPPVAITPRAGFGSMLHNACVFLKAVTELTEVYHTPDLIESHTNIWMAMRKAQLPRP